jgi:hypothetical protein
MFRQANEAGEWRTQDAYVAIYEEIVGRRPATIAARYQFPVLMHPHAFSWRASQEIGVSHKHLGTFSERGTSAAFCRLDFGATHRISGLVAPLLCYLLHGSIETPVGQFDGPTAFMISPDDTVWFTARDECEMFLIQLPDLRQ